MSTRTFGVHTFEITIRFLVVSAFTRSKSFIFHFYSFYFRTLRQLGIITLLREIQG